MIKCVPNTKEDLKEVVNVLKDGGVIAHPADTCYGLAADLMNEKSLRKLQAIKGRDKDKPMSIMLPAFMRPQLEDYANLNDFTREVCDKLLPGPVTILLPKGPKIPEYFFPEHPSIGVRIPYDIMTDELLTKFQGPLITTSANLSNEPPCGTSEEVTDAFKNNEHVPDLVLEGAIRNMCLPSTVISLKGDEVKILREGPINKKQLEGILGLSVKTLQNS